MNDRKKVTFVLSETEAKEYLRLNPNKIKFTFTGIGIKVEVKVDKKWVDITEYNNW